MNNLEAELIEWSGELLNWQRDLMRHLAGGSALQDADVRAYAKAAIQEATGDGLPWFTAPESPTEIEMAPLDSTHLTVTESGSEPVRIKKILHLQDANRLAPGASLEFETAGLTIIAGSNGSGKSGYTRILKQVAASRSVEGVLPNAFKSSAVPMATISYLDGLLAAQDLSWSSNVEKVESPLQRVRVFDSHSAGAHLSKNAEVVYVPPALRLLADYITSLQWISTVVNQELEKLNLQERSWPDLKSTEAVKMLSELGTVSGVQALHSFVVLTEDEEKELEALPARISELSASNPAKLALQAKGRAGQLATLSNAVTQIGKKLSVVGIQSSVTIFSNLSAARAEAASTQVAVSEAGKFPGTGNDKWQILWEAATAFSKDVPALHFDQDDSTICPLCQQSIEDDAKRRWHIFSEFMRGEAQEKLRSAKELRENDLLALKALRIDELTAETTAELVRTYDDELNDLIEQASDAVQTLSDYLVLNIEKENEPESSLEWNQLSTALESLIVGITKELDEHAAAELEQAETLADSEQSAEKALLFDADLQRLLSRKGIVAARSQIGFENDRRLMVTVHEAARSACATRAATIRNTKLAQSYVTSVCQQFEKETQLLGLNRVPVELRFDKADRGVNYIKVALRGADMTPAATVLSEGEQRVTAIAGFFADLTESGDTSALVFDDPVSSLDQEFRTRVARRLLAESEIRQVLVFTHDFSFVQYLFEEKVIRDKERISKGLEPNTDLGYLHITRTPAGSGVPTTSEHWRRQPLRMQIGKIKERIQGARSLHDGDDPSGYEARGRDIVGAIREAWESFVELEFLNNVVTRHERGIQTKRLSKLSDISDQDIALIDLGMTVESRFMTGHSAPVSDGSAPLDPDELLGEVKRLEEFRAKVEERRKKKS